jgi:hypothetical protein
MVIATRAANSTKKAKKPTEEAQMKIYQQSLNRKRAKTRS